MDVTIHPGSGPHVLPTFRRREAISGKGLVLVHFACGAFQEWPEFVELAGRVFHSVLGHDVEAFASPDVKRLFRNACAWGAWLEPLD